MLETLLILLCISLVFLAIAVPVIIFRGLKRNNWQFSLKSLLLFVTVFAVWLSQFTCKPFGTLKEGFDWKRDSGVIIVWIILAGIYLSRRYIVTFSIHCMAILFCELFLIFVWATNVKLTSLADFGWSLTMGCFFGTMISFPVWILELCSFMSRSKKDFSEDIEELPWKKNTIYRR